MGGISSEKRILPKFGRQFECHNMQCSKYHVTADFSTGYDLFSSISLRKNNNNNKSIKIE